MNGYLCSDILIDGKSSEDTNTEGAAEDSGLGNDKHFSGSDSSLTHVTSSNAPSPTESYLFLVSVGRVAESRDWVRRKTDFFEPLLHFCSMIFKLFVINFHFFTF